VCNLHHPLEFLELHQKSTENSKGISTESVEIRSGPESRFHEHHNKTARFAPGREKGLILECLEDGQRPNACPSARTTRRGQAADTRWRLMKNAPALTVSPRASMFEVLQGARSKSSAAEMPVRRAHPLNLIQVMLAEGCNSDQPPRQPDLLKAGRRAWPRRT